MYGGVTRNRSMAVDLSGAADRHVEQHFAAADDRDARRGGRGPFDEACRNVRIAPELACWEIHAARRRRADRYRIDFDVSVRSDGSHNSWSSTRARRGVQGKGGRQNRCYYPALVRAGFPRSNRHLAEGCVSAR